MFHSGYFMRLLVVTIPFKNALFNYDSIITAHAALHLHHPASRWASTQQGSLKELATKTGLSFFWKQEAHGMGVLGLQYYDQKGYPAVLVS